MMLTFAGKFTIRTQKEWIIRRKIGQSSNLRIVPSYFSFFTFSLNQSGKNPVHPCSFDGSHLFVTFLKIDRWMTWRIFGNRLLRRHHIDLKSAKFSSRMSSPTSKPIVAVCQMTSTADKTKNFECCQNLVKSAKKQNACVCSAYISRWRTLMIRVCKVKSLHSQMVFLPEACDFVCDNVADILKNAETKDGPLISRYQSLARDNDVWLSLGGIHIKVLQNWIA